MPEGLEELQLFPRPRVLERTGGVCASPGNILRTELHPDLGAESYEIRIGPEGTEIRYGDDRGLRYAEQTFGQIRQSAPAEVPCLLVKDSPDFPVRGYMLDISRDRVPTRETLERLVDFLSRLRINHLQLYTEHTYAYRDHEAVWRDASPITPEDVVWLQSLCAKRGIELAANQNAFGHMERWLQHPRYQQLAEAPEGWQTRWGTTQKPSVLAPTDESFELVRGLFEELLPAFTSPRVNINCDETFELGKGLSQQEVERRGRGPVYVDFLLRILDLLHGDGREVLFWGDIVRQSPDQMARLPRADTTALAWHYEAPTDPKTMPAEIFDILGDFGIYPELFYGFRAQLEPFAEAGFPFWVCPGTSSWNSLIGRLPNARANMLDAAEHGLRSGAGGYLITDWGDSGHLQPWSVSLPPLAYGAAVSWCCEANRDVPTAGFLDREIFQDASGGLASALERAGELYAETGVQPMNGSILHYQLLGGGLSFLARLMGSPQEKGLARVVEELDGIMAQVEAAQLGSDDAAIVQREIRQAARLARHGAWRSAMQSGFPAPSPATLRRDLREAIDEQRECWLARSRPGGLRDSLARLEGSLAEYGD